MTLSLIMAEHGDIFFLLEKIVMDCSESTNDSWLEKPSKKDYLILNSFFFHLAQGGGSQLISRPFTEHL